MAAARRRTTSPARTSAVAAASAVGGQHRRQRRHPRPSRPLPTAGQIAEVAAGSAQGLAALQVAETQIGVPYVWGGETPGVGFDCSGLVQWAWAKAGITIPRTTESQWPEHGPRAAQRVAARRPALLLQPRRRPPVDHVVMYAGSGPWGTNTIIAAAYTGTNISLAPIFTAGLIGAARP